MITFTTQSPTSAVKLISAGRYNSAYINITVPEHLYTTASQRTIHYRDRSDRTSNSRQGALGANNRMFYNTIKDRPYLMHEPLYKSVELLHFSVLTERFRIPLCNTECTAIQSSLRDYTTISSRVYQHTAGVET